jgi:hypothetical protein
MRAVPVSPLSINQLTRDYWGQYDAAIIAQLAQLASDPCYQIKLYKVPSDDQEVLPAFGYVTCGLRVTPGSIIFGFYNPMLSPSLVPMQPYTVQCTDVSLGHTWWDDPIGAVFLCNFKPTYQSNETNNQGSFPNLLCAPYPVVGTGQFDFEIQETSGSPQRIQLVLGVLEVCPNGR